jgi:hypothetical protein
MKNYTITEAGTVQEGNAYDATSIRARNITEARARFLQFARRALKDPPSVRVTPRAYQVAFHIMEGIHVDAGHITRVHHDGRIFPACSGGTKATSTDKVSPSDASFAYYDGEEYNRA